MSTILLLQVDPPSAAQLRQVAGLVPLVTFTEVAAADRLVAAIQAPQTPVAALVIGAEIAHPTRLVQQMHAVDKDVGVLILTAPQQVEELSQTLRFTPFIGEDVQCCAVGPAAALAQALADTIRRTQQRRNHRRSLAAVNAQLGAPPPSGPLPATRDLPPAPLTNSTRIWLSALILNQRAALAANLTTAARQRSPFYAALPADQVQELFSTGYQVLAQTVANGDVAPLRTFLKGIMVGRLRLGAATTDLPEVVALLGQEVRQLLGRKEATDGKQAAEAGELLTPILMTMTRLLNDINRSLEGRL